MPRYFIEVSYNGTQYAGFQVQKNAITIQSEVERALTTCFRQIFVLTGSSRTDAGVHAIQNFFHFDTQEELLYKTNDLSQSEESIRRSLYSLNSILPWDIVIKRIIKVDNNLHCRFNAVSREYKYQIFKCKNPFYKEAAWFYPYNIDINYLQEAAKIILHTKDFTSFSKKNTQVNNFICSIHKSEWKTEDELLVYTIVGNRFLRGMVRGLVGTMLLIGTGKISIESFNNIIAGKNCNKVNFAVPPQGLFLVEVKYPKNLSIMV